MSRDPKIVASWLRWLLARYDGRTPHLEIDEGVFEGFPNFSSYLGAWRYRPDHKELRFLRSATRDAETIIDVGANFGVFTVLFSKAAPASRIFAFEPCLATCDALTRNLSLNAVSNVTVVSKAVGSVEGKVGFTNGDDPATNRVVADSGAIEVPSVTLDDFLAERRISRVDFLKIDVEGFELEVLKGGTARIFGTSHCKRDDRDLPWQSRAKWCPG